MKFSRSTTLLELVNSVGEHPEFLHLTLGTFCEIADANTAKEGGMGPNTRLSEFYRDYYKKLVSLTNGVNQDTIQKRERALRLWYEIVGDLPLKEIGREACAAYVRGLREKKWTRGKDWQRYRPATIREKVRAVASVLLAAGPPSPKLPHGAGIIQVVPAFPPIRVYNDVSTKTPTIEELGAILRACECTRGMKMDVYFPPETLKEGQEIDGPTWWRAFYTFLYNTGLRYGETSRAKWGDIRRTQGRYILHISVDVEKTHMEKNIPLNSAAREALERIPQRGKDELIFGLHKKGKLVYWYRKIARTAGLPKSMCSPHAMRRMVGTYAENPQKVLGHTNAATTQNHYMSISAVARSLDRLPQPEGENDSLQETE